MTREQIRTWRNYLADELMEAQIYSKLAEKRSDEEREILLELSKAEQRHANHWIELLGEHAYPVPKPSLKSRFLATLAFVFGSIFVLATIQRTEERAKYTSEIAATPQMFADEQVHAEVVRALAAKSRDKMSNSFRAAIFGMNDGVVSNLSLILGVFAAGVDESVVLATGFAGLLAGALSMGAGEYISVKSQLELINSSKPNAYTDKVIANLDVNENELALIFRARGDDAEEADKKARQLLASIKTDKPLRIASSNNNADDESSAFAVASFSFVCFAVGAVVPLLPFFLNVSAVTMAVLALGLSGVMLVMTGSVAGILSGTSPIFPAIRQLFIGYFAATVTFALGTLFQVGV